MMTIYIVIGVLTLIAISYYSYKRWKANKENKEDMAVGLEVYDSNGKKTFSSDDLTYRILGTFSTSMSDGSITDNNIGGREVWMIVMYVDFASNTQFLVSPCYSVSGNTISWSFPTYDSKWDRMMGKCSHVVSYGVYK